MVVLRVVLAFGLLLAHTPVCKVAVLNACAQAKSHPTTEVRPCCGKCAKARDHTRREPAKPPAKPACPTGTECVLCGAPAAVLPAAVVSELVARPTGRLVEFDHVRAADGFHTLLDRPPRG